MRVAKGLIVAAILVLSAASLAAAQGLTATDVFELEYVSDPQISPDGQQIVYVRRWADIEKDRTYSNLWIVNFDGSRHRPLTSGRYSDGSPRWSPDGTRLAFVSDRSGSPQIHLRYMDSGLESVLTHLQTPPRAPAFSPDGSQIAFIALVPSKGPQIAEMPSPPAGAEWAEPAMVVDSLIYRFDGRGYLPHGYAHIHVVPAEGGTARQLTSGDYHHGGAGFLAADVVWTPDGKHLLFAANRRDDWEYELLDSEIWEVALADGSMRALTNREGPDQNPAISPDGERIAYLGFDDRSQGYQLTQLYVMNRDGSQPTLVSSALDQDVSNPAWAPDGQGIFFTYTEHGVDKLALLPLRGWQPGEIKTLFSDLGTGRSAYAGGAGFSLASGGHMAFSQTFPDRPGDVAAASADSEARLVTGVNDDLMAQRDLGQVEEIWWESSHDQRKIQGWIIKPPDFDPSNKYPMVLEIHGGPFAAYGPRFDLEKQVLAGKGYVVLYANPRGSTSYGEEFGNLIHHAYPGDDFYDLDSGVDAVIEQGYVDPSKVFVGGGSGGGVLTCWMIGRSQRFRAAVSYYPVINWYSWVLSADIASFGVKYWFPGMPWDHPEHYESRSLLSVVKNVTTPTMVITGEEDWRTPMSESEQYYTALKLLKVEAVLVRVPGESHGIAGRPSHHLSKMLHISGWFDRYLEEEGTMEETSGR
ncbi:MAG TPA: S9 family peptidase [Acidobacteriota bacterium]|nr:S9 family peptidase [Acidobacteriota bacterium]